MIGTVTQVFATGDFSLWSESRARMFMVYTNRCPVASGHTVQVGDRVQFELADGRVVSVRSVQERATALAHAAVAARIA